MAGWSEDKMFGDVEITQRVGKAHLSVGKEGSLVLL